jgi:hypothetical protein
MKKTTAIIALFAAAALPASAAVLIFDGGPDGTGTSVSVAENWNPDQVPTASDDLTIGAGFATTGNFGGTGTPANTLLLQGSHSSTWALITMTIDGGSITLGGGGNPFGGTAGNADLINGGTMTFTAKTAAEVVSQYADDITIDGTAAVFGSDPLALEPGDNAYITENATSGGDNVTVNPVPEPTTSLLFGVLFTAGMFRRRRK